MDFKRVWEPYKKVNEAILILILSERKEAMCLIYYLLGRGGKNYIHTFHLLFYTYPIKYEKQGHQNK